MLEVRRVDHRQVVTLQVSTGIEQTISFCTIEAEELVSGPLHKQEILHFPSQ